MTGSHTGIKRPYIELRNPGTLRTGEHFFLIDYFPTRKEGGGCIGVWDGTSYDAAIEAAAAWEREGIPCHDTAGSGR
jgi:hypothetical protein